LRLAAIDLDGTLLGSDGTLSPRTKAAVADAARAGIDIVLVTARGPRTVGDLAAELGIAGEAICSNGGMLLDLATQTIDRVRAIEPDVALGLVRGLRERLPGIVFAVERERFAHEPGFEAWDWVPPPETRIGDAEELLAEPPTKLVLLHPGHSLEAIAAVARELAGESVTVSISGTWVVEVSAAGVNKAAALAELCDERAIESRDVIAFGDHLNDLPMLAWAGHAVAVANAHPEVIEIADEVTASNDEDGVALVLERLSA